VLKLKDVCVCVCIDVWGCVGDSIDLKNTDSTQMCRMLVVFALELRCTLYA